MFLKTGLQSVFEKSKNILSFVRKIIEFNLRFYENSFVQSAEVSFMRKTKSFYVFLFCLLTFAGCQNAVFEEIKVKPISEDNIIQTEQSDSENSEEKAVRLAEEFIRKNGYTDEPADKDNLSYETVEFSANIDELLEERNNTLEKKAFGIFFQGRGGEKGFTVAFRINKSKFKDLSEKEYNSLGRAVTMNEKFENLRVEHQSLFLQKVDRKF